MSEDSDYVEGDAHSEPADAPETDAPRGKPDQGGIDSSAVSDAPVMYRPKSAARMAESRKAFAAAVLANKDKPAAAKPADDDILDPEDPAPTAPIAALAVAAKAKTGVAAPTPPPAPSLDPEVRALRESLKTEREAIARERAELEKQRAVKPAEPSTHAPSAALDIESYLDNAPSWLRGTFEAMRADKMTDDEFKSEVADLVTMLTGDVLGVPLPENIRIKLEAAQAKKMVRTNKTIQTRKEQEASARAEKDRAAATEKAEIERVEQEWNKASQVLSQQFTGAESVAAKAHPWLAAEDEPGKIIVDVIRAAVSKDGTQLSWQEAAKQANDYLEAEAKKYYGKRSALLGSPTPAAKPAVPVAAKPATPAPVVERPAVTTTPSGNQRWNGDKHRENTRAAFRAQLTGKTD